MAAKHNDSRSRTKAKLPFKACRNLLLLTLAGIGNQAFADPFISEYVEGSSNNKALEIFNPDTSSFDLTNCQIKMYFNGSTTATIAHTFASGTLASGDVFVLANPLSTAPLLALADATTASSTWFNGDDAVELVCPNGTKDIIGQIGLDPGAEWGTGLVSMADNTIRRKSAVCAGDVDGSNAFDPAPEWDGLAVDTFDGLGSHNANCSTTPSVNLSVSANSSSETDTTVITVTATASSAVSGDQTVDLTVSGTGIDAGDYSLTNITIAILGGTTTGSVTFTVVDDALVEGSETATLTIGNPSTGITLGSALAQIIAITDNDAAIPPGVTVTQSGGNTAIAEGGATDSYTLVLNAQPSADVTINVEADAQLSVDNAALTFTTANWNVPQTVTVTALDDAVFEGSHTGAISHVVSSTDAGYNGIGVTGIVANITDNDPEPGTACGDPATKISAVQGSGPITPMNGIANTRIEGVVVGDYQGASNNSLRGFFVQEEDTDDDGNPATSEGIFVFDGNTALASVNVGDRVRVTGTPAEFFNMTQIGTVTNVQVCATHQDIPTPAALTLPVPGIPSGDLTLANDAVNAYYEPFEGMMVTIPSTLKVSEYFELERYGQLVLTQGGRIASFTNVNKPSASGFINHQIELAKRQIILDDKNNIQNFALSNNQPLPYPTGGLSLTNRFRGGDEISHLTGVLHWSFAGQTGTDAWRIRPVEELFDYLFTSANPRKPLAPNTRGTLKVASFNVLNYFTTVDTTASSTSGPCGPDGVQDCRGADSTAEVTRQTDKAAAALCGMNADIVGLMEIENNASDSLSALVTAANLKTGCGPYDFVNTGTIGGDAIKVGLLYKTTTVSPSGLHALLNTAVDPRFIDTKNRPTLAQTFTEIASGEKLTVAVNHLKSKGSDCLDVGDPDLNDGQGNCSQTRKNAALAMMDWLAADPTGSGDQDFLIIGDLNSYALEETIDTVEKGADDTLNTLDDYTNLVKLFGGAGAYSYVFDGQTGYLDHALASKSLLSQVTSTADWHINSDEPPSFDYNDTIRDTGEASFEAKPARLPLYAANQYRTSDHDPVVVGLRLGQTINIINGTKTANVLTGTSGKDRITGFGGADSITGGLGNDDFVYTAFIEGADTITDFRFLQDKIVLTALLQAVQYQGNNPIIDGYVKFDVSGVNTIISIDSDGNAGPLGKRKLVTVNNISINILKNAANFVF